MQRIVRLLLCGLACALTAAAAAPSSSVHIPPGHTPFLRPSSEIGPNNVRVDRTTDCAIKSLALEYATQLQGNFQPAVPSLVHDALQLGTECNLEEPIREQEKQYSEFFPTQLRWRGNAKPFERPVEDAIALWVDGTNGQDSNPGSQAAPFATFQRALQWIRFLRPVSGPVEDLAATPATVWMRKGVYFVGETIEFGVRDSYITIAAYNSEEVVFSGGVDLSALSWSVYEGNVLVAPLPEGVKISVDALNELYINGRRAVRARYPNGNPETQGLWTVNNTGHIYNASSWLPVFPHDEPYNISILTPQRNSLNFPNYQQGVGGAAEVFQPQTSFWCSAFPPQGSTFMVPSGLVYYPKDWSNRSYSDPSIAYLHTYHGLFWGNWIFQISDILPQANTIAFQPGGGTQEARGTNFGADWYIENLLEELDSPEEWWVDAVNGMIYYYPNVTTSEMIAQKDGTFKFASDSIGTLIASQLPTIFTVQGGSPSSLVIGFTLQDLTFSHTSSTFMEKMEVPSGGDWTITRSGAVRMEYVRNATVLECVWNGIGGNGLVVSRTAWNTSIIANEFVWIGSSAVLVAGEVQGIDGSSEVTFPIGTFVHANLFHELGIWVKQSSAVGIVLAQATTIDSNICFNLARACVNINDGFAGGHSITNNLLFNSVRETDDHGPFNSWDRQPYIFRRADGSISMIPDESYITHNFLFGDYHSVWPIDHDDGSQYYTDSQNYIIYGGYKSYLGNSLTVLDNVYVLPDGKVDAWEESRKERSGEEESLFANEKLQSSVLDGLSSIMKARARNLDQRYRVDKRKYDERDQRRAAGLPPSTASSLDQADDGALGWSRNWGQYCAQDGGGYGHLWENNTCAVMSVANIYNFWQCDPDNLPLSIPFVAANNLYASGQINITCAASGKWWTLQSFQAIGYDLLTTQYPPATLDQLISWGRATFNLSSSSSSEATAAPLEDQPISAYAALCR